MINSFINKYLRTKICLKGDKKVFDFRQGQSHDDFVGGDLVFPDSKACSRRISGWKGIIATLALSLSAATGWGQLTLPAGTSYTETFDSISTGLPSGWTIRTGASSTSRGTAGAFTTTAISWSDSGGAFKNLASADGGLSSDSTATQSARTDRTLGIRQAIGDPGAAFELELANTTGKTSFSLSLKHQMLSVQTRSTVWSVQYSTTGSSWTTLGTYTDPGVWGSTSSGALSLGSAINNISGPVYLRVVALNASTGSGSRDTYAIDDFSLTWSASTPTLNAATLGAALSTTAGTASAGASFTAAGSNLTGDITVTPQPGYEVATTQNGTYGSAAITVANNATVWVRFAATVAVGTYNSTTVAVLSGGGASSTANVTTTSSGNNVAPANDLSSNPTSITVNGAAANGTTVAATVVAPFTDSKNDVWYSFTPTTSGTVTLTTTSSSSQDLDIQAWASAAPSSSTANQLISNGADPGNTTEIATLTVTADTIYFVRVLQFGGTAGTFTITAALPTITGAATASAFTTTYGTASAAQNFAVSGSNLTANIVATAPTGFQVSSDGTTYDGTATFTQSGGSASGTLRVRLAVTAPVIGNYNSQNIVLSTTGGGNVNITTAASGNSVSQKALTITGATAANKVYNGTTAIAVSGGSLTTGSGAGQVLSADSANVTLSAASAAGTVADANVGTSKAVTVTGYSISGASAGNYSITQPTGLTANITAKDLTITGLSAANKNWDGTTAVSVTGAPEYVGLVAGEPFRSPER